MKEIHIQYFKTDLGELILGSFENELCLCDWRYRKMRQAVDERIQTGLQASFVERSSEVIEEAQKQFLAYLHEGLQVFSIPLLFVGTDFQKKVWHALLDIPFGKTATYLELSQLLQNPKAIRAVAAANGANALSIFVPCHRIIGSDGELIGYAGGLPAKQKLLQLENSYPQREQMTLFAGGTSL